MADTSDNEPNWARDLHEIGLEVGRPLKSSIDIGPCGRRMAHDLKAETLKTAIRFVPKLTF